MAHKGAGLTDPPGVSPGEAGWPPVLVCVCVCACKGRVGRGSAAVAVSGAALELCNGVLLG